MPGWKHLSTATTEKRISLRMPLRKRERVGKPQILAHIFIKELCIFMKSGTVKTPGVCLGLFSLADDLEKKGTKTGHRENIPGFGFVWV